MGLTRYTFVEAVALVAIVGTCVGVVFKTTDDFKSTAERLQQLRYLMQDNDYVTEPIQAYIIPSVDSHQSEYTSERDRRMAYVSGFTGSAGTVVVTDTEAILWTDSRYFIQAEAEMDPNHWTLKKSGLPEVPTLSQWLTANDAISIIGVDPFLIDANEFATLSQQLTVSGKQLVPIIINLVDAVWTDKPAAQFPVIEPLSIEFSGKLASEKVAAVRGEMSMLGGQGLVLSALDEIAWLLNLRGSDISNNPFFFAYALLTNTEIQLYVHPNRVTAEIRQHFDSEGIDVIVENYDSISDGIKRFLTSMPATAHVILPKISQGIQELVPAHQIITAQSPVVLMKAVKNAVEAEGMRNAHIRDGAAVIKYLHYLETNVDTETITELSGADVLEAFRKEGQHFKGLSFNAISAVGPHAAMAHYSPTVETATRISRNELYLIDSGGQYLDGTTDITRTIHLGKPSAEEKDAFTRVLKGFISLARTVFPPGAPYSFFDAMARRALWDAGLDFGHGTGHGVGAYMGVHEVPPRIISTNSAPGMVENLFTSNEPGYYLENFYGIRIEDVVQVVPLEMGRQLRGNFDGLGVLQIYDITMVPIQIKLIDLDLLTTDEVDWLNEYHARVKEKTQSLLEPVVYDWLVTQTEPIIARDSFDLRCSSTC